MQNSSELQSRTIGVHPAVELEKHARLFAAIEQFYDVHFVATPLEQLGTMQTAVLFASEVAPNLPVPAKSAHWAVFICPEPGAEKKCGPISFLNAKELDPILRGRTLTEDRVSQCHSISPVSSDVVLASCEMNLLWVRRNQNGLKLDLFSAGLDELQPDEILCDQLQPGRFFPVLALVHFLRAALGEAIWQPPPLRAAYIIDDPNLHANSYGYMNFSKLARHADQHNYHIAIATIPLDGWFASSTVARTFSENVKHLSLLMHGNNHTKRELAQEISGDEISALLAQSLRRIEAFEKRSGLEVSRVMAPPHGACYEPTMREMRRLGFEGIAVSQPYQGLLEKTPKPVTALWEPADMMAGGLPAMQRIALTQWQEDSLVRERVILYAFLGKPLILYGHHNDFASGFELLADSAAQINGLGAIEWMPFSSICRSNFLTRREGNTLHLKPLFVRASIPLAPDVDSVILHPPRGIDSRASLQLEHGGEAFTHPFTLNGPRISRDAHDHTLNFSIGFADQLNSWDVPPPAFNPKALVRRLLTETRDRLQPLMRR
jgi:hypothetical protein